MPLPCCQNGIKRGVYEFCKTYASPALEFLDFVTNVLCVWQLFVMGHIVWCLLSGIFLFVSALSSARIGYQPVREDFEYRKHKNRYLYDSQLQNLNVKKNAGPSEEQLQKMWWNKPAACWNWCTCTDWNPPKACGGSKCPVSEVTAPKLPLCSIEDCYPNTNLMKPLGMGLGAVHLWPFCFLGVSVKLPVGRGLCGISSYRVVRAWPREKQRDLLINRFLSASAEATPQLFLQVYVALWLTENDLEASVPLLFLVSPLLSILSQVWALTEWWWALFGGDPRRREANRRWAVPLFAAMSFAGLLSKVTMYMYFWVTMGYTAYLLLLCIIPGRLFLAVYWEKVSPFVMMMRIPYDFLLIKSFQVAVGGLALNTLEMLLCLCLPSPDNLNFALVFTAIFVGWLIEKFCLAFFAHEYHLYNERFRQNLTNFFCCFGKIFCCCGRDLLLAVGTPVRVRDAAGDALRRGAVAAARPGGGGVYDVQVEGGRGEEACLMKDVPRFDVFADKTKDFVWDGLEELWRSGGNISETKDKDLERAARDHAEQLAQERRRSASLLPSAGRRAPGGMKMQRGGASAQTNSERQIDHVAEDDATDDDEEVESGSEIEEEV